ncbi:uncharacterized protein LOC110834004 isoform X2 [Zootermopsis nevadensis]|nr:uncharacterized protein LOC110834004 isoform X2 [Zootermopsis nevadensis]XP_021928390.1 uncharacterized protein LOC110834004 isoform X2 [Zootermopsis nevadensis]
MFLTKPYAFTTKFYTLKQTSRSNGTVAPTNYKMWSSNSNYTLVKKYASHQPTSLLDELSDITYQETLHKIRKRRSFNGVTFIKPIKHIVKRILSIYYKYKPEIQLITCVTRHFNVQIHNLFQQQGHQRIRAPANNGSHLANKSYDSSQMKNQLIKISKITNESAADSDVNNFKKYDEYPTGKNEELLDGIMYQVVRECLTAVVDLAPRLGRLLYVVYNVWKWSERVTELVNRNQMALCIRKFIEKKFWDWIDTDKYELI